MEACAFSAMLCADVVSTTVSTIIITFNNVSVIIAKSISNQGMVFSCTSLYQMTNAFRTGICVCIHNTTVPTIIVAVWIVGLIVAETITNQCNVMTSWNDFESEGTKMLISKNGQCCFELLCFAYLLVGIPFGTRLLYHYNQIENESISYCLKRHGWEELNHHNTFP